MKSTVFVLLACVVAASGATLLALLLVFVRPAVGDACVLTMGSQYQLKSDTVDWTMQTSSGQSCIRGLRHNRVAIDTAKLVSPPQSGQVKLLGPGFSYRAKSDFQGQDSFTIQVSGMLNGIRGSSDIRIVVSVGPKSPSSPSTPNPPNSLTETFRYTDDGHAQAPHAAIQKPNLLTSYAARAPWKVAGVDYAVGVPAGMALTDWQNLRGPGISIVGNLIRVDNTSGVHIDGVDFSLHGGAILLFANSPDAIVTNSKFQATTSTRLIDSRSLGLTVEYCTLIGGADGSGLIGAAGNVVVQYNWMKDFPQHALEVGDSINLTYRYNLIENGGTVAGAHLNYLQQMGKGVTNTVLIAFNTTYQTPQPGSGEGFQFDINDGTNSGTLVNPTFAYNTMIAKGAGAMSYMVHGSSRYSGSNPQLTPIKGDAVVHHNYFDASGAYGPFYPNSFSKWKVFENRDMVTGVLIR